MCTVVFYCQEISSKKKGSFKKAFIEKKIFYFFKKNLLLKDTFC